MVQDVSRINYLTNDRVSYLNAKLCPSQIINDPKHPINSPKINPTTNNTMSSVERSLSLESIKNDHPSKILVSDKLKNHKVI